MRRAVTSRPGSARRLSQPLSGFLANPSFAALFHAATVPGILPSECSPRRDRAPLSRPLGSPAVIHQPAGVHCPSALSPLVSPTPTLSRGRLTPPAAMSALSTNRSPLPGCPGLQAAEPPSSASFTCFEASIPLRVRSRTSPSCPVLAADALLGFVPSRVFSNHASGPRPAQATRTQARARVRRPRPATEGTLQPPQPGETCQSAEAPGRPRRRIPAPLEDRTGPPLGGPPPPTALELQASPSLTTLGVSKYAVSGISSEEAPTLLRFLTSSPVSQL